MTDGSIDTWSPCGALPCVFAACARASDAARRCMAGRASARHNGRCYSGSTFFRALGRKMAAGLPFLLKITPGSFVHS